MSFEFSTLEPQIHQILSAPGTDLATISAKRVRRQLLEADPTLTPEFLKENKEDVDFVIGRVFEKVSEGVNVGSSEEVEDPETEPLERDEIRKRKQEYDSVNEEDEEEEEDGTSSPKKAKKARKKELSDAELARKLSNEINGRSRRTKNKGRSSSNGTFKRGGRARKSAATVDSDGESSDEDAGKKPNKRKSGRAGAAKGGFAKEYVLSEPLAALLQTDKLSRPQVVKQLWDYIKGNELQNPSNKREIVCDAGFRAIFGVDKIDMFKMNKVLGQHLHENEG